MTQEQRRARNALALLTEIRLKNPDLWNGIVRFKETYVETTMSTRSPESNDQVSSIQGHQSEESRETREEFFLRISKPSI